VAETPAVAEYKPPTALRVVDDEDNIPQEEGTGWIHSFCYRLLIEFFQDLLQPVVVSFFLHAHSWRGCILYAVSAEMRATEF
jgi:hypothetical protein